MQRGRTRPRSIIGAVLAALLVACGADVQSSPASQALTDAPATPSPTPAVTPTPSPTPEPTPRYSNQPDAALAALIPTAAAGRPVHVAPIDGLSLAPGDLGEVYGEVGLRFVSLVAAYVDQPRTTLYAVRVEGAPVTTQELEPYLAEAGRYVGIAGLVREPWVLATVGGRQVWVRAADRATVSGTQVYTWAAGKYVFLLIGVDANVNQALVAGLPGEPPPTPPPSPSAEPTPTATS